MRPKSDLNQFMYADCRLCSDMDKNNAVLGKCHSPVTVMQYFSQIHAQKACLFAMHFWYCMTVYVYPNAQSVMVFCIGFTISYTRRKKTALYACIEELCADW